MRRHDRSTVLVACTFAFFATFYARMAISPVIPFISDDFAVSNAAIGLALTGMWLTYGIAQYPSGILGDRYGERAIILLAVGGTTVASLLLVSSPLFPVFVVCVVLLGAMAGLHYSPATTLLARTHENVGRAIGVHLLGSPAAGLLAPVIAAWIGVQYGWRPAIATVVVLGIPILLLVKWGIPRATPQRPDESIRDRLSAAAGGHVIRRPAILFTLVIAMLGTFVIQGLMTFLPTFLVEHQAYSATLAGIAFSGFFVVRAAAQFVLGAISDAYPRDLAIAGAMLLGSVGILGLVVAPGPVALAVGVVCVGFGMGFFAVIEPRFIDALGAAEQGAGFGFVRTVYLIIGSAGSVAVGVFADLFGWPVSFAVLSGLLAIAFLAVLVNWIFDLGY